MVIAIDGPSGSGKSTVARKLANRLAFIHLNSGALFRTVGLFAKEKGVPLEDDAAVAQLARALRFRFELNENDDTVFLVDGVDVTSRLAEEEVGALASRVALLPSVRQVLLEVQRAAAAEHSLVVEGRDSGTIVFPNAERKFYLDTNLEVRARRRLLELQSRTDSSSKAADAAQNESRLGEVLEQLAARDRQDANRKVAPHRRAEDSILIDASDKSPEEVVDFIVLQIEEASNEER